MFRDAERFAFDRASVRTYDSDGHLHVAVANISKAAVNPYRGSEIPGHQQLGLHPDRIYQLLRHPEELKRAAQTFAGKPLLIKHTPLNASDHPSEKVVGSIGTSVQYNHPYLSAPLTVWHGDAINRIKSGAQHQLSSGYKYRPDMTPGTYQGQRYDGVMRDIVGNHVALVPEGRAGDDVVIGDSKENVMGAKPLTRGTVVSVKKYVDHFAKGGKLAQDASIADLIALLDAFSDGSQEIPPAEPGAETLPAIQASTPPSTDAPDPNSPPGVQPPLDNEVPGEAGAANAGSPVDKVKAFLQGKLSPEDMQQLEALVAQIGGEGEGGAPPPAAVKPPGDPAAKPPAAAKPPGDPAAKPPAAKPANPNAPSQKKVGDAGEAVTQANANAGYGQAVRSSENANILSAPFKEQDINSAQGKMDRTSTQTGYEGNSDPYNLNSDGKILVPKFTAKDKELTMPKPAMDAAFTAEVAKQATTAAIRIAGEIRDAERMVRPLVGDLVMSFDSAEKVHRHALKAVGEPDVDKIDASALPALIRHQITAKQQGSRPTPNRLAMDTAGADDFLKRYPGAERIGFAG